AASRDRHELCHIRRDNLTAAIHMVVEMVFCKAVPENQTDELSVSVVTDAWRTYFPFFFAARIAAHRFFVASIIRRRPSGLRRRFVFFAAGAAACVEATLFAAHLFRIRSDSRLRPAALKVRRPVCGDVGVGAEVPPVILCRT